MARTEEIAVQALEGNSRPVWQLAIILRIRKRRSRVAAAPIFDSDSNVVACKEELIVLWAQQFAAEFSGQVTGMSSSQMSLLPEDRKLQSLVPTSPEAFNQLAYLSRWTNGWIFVQQIQRKENSKLRLHPELALHCIW